jgi:hypothetical protein
MGIYDRGLNFDFDFSYHKLKKPLMAIAALIALAIIVMAVLSIASMFGPKTISYYFSKNPISSKEQTHIIVTVINLTEGDARNIAVNVKARDESAIMVLENTKTIKLLEKDLGKRELWFLVNPVGDTIPGNYILDITTELNGKQFKEEAVLTIE